MKYLLLSIIVFLQSCSVIKRAEQEVVDAWETGIPNHCRPWGQQGLIDKKFIFEVSKSSFDFASYYLSRDEIIKLTNNEVNGYLGYIPAVSEKVQPYLVRALYGHSGTGAYSFGWCDEGIFISHGSLGRFSVINRTAFILYLPKSPVKMYLEVSIDE